MSMVKTEESSLVNSSKYRQYVAAVDKALKAFEYTTEWADLIAALGKLNKVLQSYSKLGDIPKPVTVAKRLSQCLHPALPSGVHLKTLETYKQIFDLLGPKGLPNALYLYAFGLFPLMFYGGIKVKTELVKIYETYFVPLGPALRPALIGFLTGVLPGMEEGSEFFDRIHSLLHQVEKSVGSDYFFACLWQCVLSSPPVRLAALTYVSSQFDRHKAMDDQLHVVGNSVDRMVCALCEAATDSSPLVQRHLLDLLCSAFPLHSEHLVKSDFVRLIQQCLFVVLKRDMSLNRRLYAWLMGAVSKESTQTEGGEQSNYFRQHSLPLIRQAVAAELKRGTKLPVASRPAVAVRLCRLLLYLLDKPELGQAILEESFMDILEYLASLHPEIRDSNREIVPIGTPSRKRRSRSLQNYNCATLAEVADNTRMETTAEHVKTLNLLLSSLDPGFVWRYLGDRFEHALNSHQMDFVSNGLSISLSYCLAAVQLDSHSDIRGRHLPKLFGRLLHGLETRFSDYTCQHLEIALADGWDLLIEIQQAAGRVDMSTGQTTFTEDSPREGLPESGSQQSFRGVHALTDESGEQIVGTEGQSAVMQCLYKYESVLEKLTDWYLNENGQPMHLKRGVIFFACSLLREFADFPLYCLPVNINNVTTITDRNALLPPWLSGLCTIATDRWEGEFADFFAKIEAFDTVLYLAVMSQSVMEQHLAYRSRSYTDVRRKSSNQSTAVLLRPIFDQNTLTLLETKGLYTKAAKQLWKSLGNDQVNNHQTAAKLMCLLHSRNQNDASSVCEDLIVKDLTSKDQDVRSEAAEKFRRLWVLTRNYGVDDLYSGIHLKPFNRAVLMMLNIVSFNESGGLDLAHTCSKAWLSDCAVNGDLPKIIQILLHILLTPRTTRVSVQYVTLTPMLTESNQMCGSRTCSMATTDGLLLHHVTGQASSDWMRELKRILLVQIPNRPQNVTLPVKTVTQSFDEDVLIVTPIGQGSIEEIVEEVLHEILDKICGPRDYELAMEAHADMETVQTLLEKQVGHSNSILSRSDSVPEPFTSPGGSELRFFDGSLDATGSSPGAGTSGTCNIFHPLHAHFLLYTEPGNDTDLAIASHVFKGLALLLRDSRYSGIASMLASCLTSTSTSSLPKSNSNALRLTDLIAKHVQSILGQDFWNETLNELASSKTKHYMLLEMVITVSLYYLRSYYLNSPTAPVQMEHLEQNWKTKISCLELLTSVCCQLRKTVIEAGTKALSSFVYDLLNKCKLQKCLLHCLMVCVHQNPTTGEAEAGFPLSTDVARFNAGSNKDCNFNYLLMTYESCLLDLVAEVITLEYQIKNGMFTSDTNSSGIVIDRLSVNQQISAVYGRDKWNSLADLRLFLLTALNALKRNYSTHEIWLRFLVKILPYLERSLASLCLHVTEQLCRNIELAVESSYRTARCGSPISSSDALLQEELPTNYIIMVLGAMTSLLHYCLIDSSQTQSNVQSSSDGSTSHVRGATDIFTNLVKAFTFSDAVQTPSSPSKSDKSTNYMQQAKTDLLGAFPHSLSTLCQLWSAIKNNTDPRVPVGSPQQVRRLVLDLLSPIALNHPTNFLSSLALVWLTRGQAKKDRSPDEVFNEYSLAQLDISDLLLSIKMLPLESLIVAALQTLKDPGKVKNINEKDMFPTEVSLLEMLHGCLQSSPVALLRSCWTALQQLLIETLSLALPPQAIFLLFQIFSDFVRVCSSSMDEKTALRQMQDVCQKLTEAVNSVAGWQLSQATWLNRKLVVKSDLSSSRPTGDLSPGFETPNSTINGKITPDQLSNSFIEQSRKDKKKVSASSSATNLASKDTNNNRRDGSLSTKALCLLATNLANIIDSICKSEDKEKLLPTLYAVWANALPCLKERSVRNAKNFLASSKLLASLSGYSYTRQVWRKAVLELFTDTNFFRMDIPSLKQWLVIVDNLTAHDKTTFKDVLGRINASQLPGLPFITSKDQEYELRSSALKRLAFVLLSSEKDQYHPQMPEIQERMTENLRLYQVPHVHAQVFLCYRVLLIRLSPQHLTPLWPSIVSELIQVLLQIEQELCTTSFLTNEELKVAHEDQWLQLYLSATKLLDSLCCLSSEYLNQFQMYEWAFVSAINSDPRQRAEEIFVPHVTRICKLMQTKFGKLTSYQKQQESSLLQVKSISNMSRLHSFFHRLAYNKSLVRPDNRNMSLENGIKYLESALHVDFLESWV